MDSTKTDMLLLTLYDLGERISSVEPKNLI